MRDLEHAKTLVVEVENYLILVGKIWKDLNKSKNSSFFLELTSSDTTDPMVQRLENEILALKKQIYQNSFFTPYKDIPRRTYPNNDNNYVPKN